MVLEVLRSQTILFEIIGWDSFDVVRFDFEPLLQGQREHPYLNMLITHYFLLPTG